MSSTTSGRGKLLAGFLVGLLVGAVSAVELVPAETLRTVSGVVVNEDGQVVDPDTGAPVTDDPGQPGTPGTGPPGTGRPGQPGTGIGKVPVAPGAKCDRLHNGGKTARGVTATSIKVATTVVKTGIGAAFLSEMQYAMDAKIREVNRSGGICGRKLDPVYKDDGWEATKGSQYLRNFFQGDFFAIAVGASSEGLRIVLEGGDVDAKGIPIVGTDGLEINQYIKKNKAAQPWVWPVATATVSSARIMVNEAYSRGARKFGVVFDKNYRFGAEAAAAFNAEVRRLTKGSNVDGYNKDNACSKLFCGIEAGQSSYSGYASSFYRNTVDFVALFLEPQTAQVWMSDANTLPATSERIKFGYGAAQPLFTRQFEANCASKCDGMVVWTGFKPPTRPYTNDPAVKAYTSSLRSVKTDADIANQFSQGAYVGMQLLVEGLKAVGPTLTRAALKIVLDTYVLRSGLTIQDSLNFSPATRFTNVTMQGFEMLYKGTVGGWRAGPIVRDTRPQDGVG